MQGPVFWSHPLDSPVEYGYSNLDLPRRGELYAQKGRDLSRAGGQWGPAKLGSISHLLVGTRGFEPPASPTPRVRATPAPRPVAKSGAARARPTDII
jgi:hypothetical protein